MTSYPVEFTPLPWRATHGRTLIVEDDRDGCETLALMLRRIGHEVEVAESVGEALVKLEAWQPDYVLLDLMLPDAYGSLVLRKIRQMGWPARVALITAAGPTSPVLRHTESYLPDAVFSKPLNYAAIREWIRS